MANKNLFEKLIERLEVKKDLVEYLGGKCEFIPEAIEELKARMTEENIERAELSKHLINDDVELKIVWAIDGAYSNIITSQAFDAHLMEKSLMNHIKKSIKMVNYCSHDERKSCTRYLRNKLLQDGFGYVSIEGMKQIKQLMEDFNNA